MTNYMDRSQTESYLFCSFSAPGWARFPKLKRTTKATKLRVFVRVILTPFETAFHSSYPFFRNVLIYPIGSVVVFPTSYGTPLTATSIIWSPFIVPYKRQHNICPYMQWNPGQKIGFIIYLYNLKYPL